MNSTRLPQSRWRKVLVTRDIYIANYYNGEWAIRRSIYVFVRIKVEEKKFSQNFYFYFFPLFFFFSIRAAVPVVKYDGMNSQRPRAGREGPPLLPSGVFQLSGNVRRWEPLGAATWRGNDGGDAKRLVGTSGGSTALALGHSVSAFFSSLSLAFSAPFLPLPLHAIFIYVYSKL